MGRASSNKKVNRAASTGGGRTAGSRTPVLWYSTIFLAVLVGVLGVYLSASDLREVAADDTAPRVGKDHWHAAYGIYICDAWVAPMKDAHGDRKGIHSHGDGLIHTHPAVQSGAGKNAKLGVFFDEVDAKTTATSIEVPKSTGAKRLKVANGDKCGKDVGVVKTVVFKNQADTKGTELKGNPSDWKIQDGQMIAVGFVSKDTVLQPPPSTANLADPGDLPTSGNPNPPSDSAPTGPSDSTPPPDGTATTVPSPSPTTTP